MSPNILSVLKGGVSWSAAPYLAGGEEEVDVFRFRRCAGSEEELCDESSDVDD